MFLRWGWPGLLTETSRVTGLGEELSRVDLSLLWWDKEVFGPVAFDPMVSRLVGTLAYHVEAVEAAVNRARRTVRQRVWDLAGEHSPTAGISAERPLAIDVDATLVNVHSEKVAYSESNPVPESYAVADSDDAGPAVGVSCAIYDAGARADTRGDDAGRWWRSGSRARRGAEAGEHVLSQLQEGEGVGCGPFASGRPWIP